MEDAIVVRQGRNADIDSMIRIYKEGSGRTMNSSRLEAYLKNYPSAIAFFDGTFAAFCFCTYFTGDIVEIANFFVVEQFRSKGIGTAILTFLEPELAKRWDSVLLSNSMLVKGIPDKRPARPLYLRNGYELIWSTDDTDVFAKKLQG